MRRPGARVMLIEAKGQVGALSNLNVNRTNTTDSNHLKAIKCSFYWNNRMMFNAIIDFRTVHLTLNYGLQALFRYCAQFVSPSPSALTSLASQLGCSLFTQANCGVRTLHLRGIRHKRELDLLTTTQSFRDVLESPELVPLSSQSVHEFVVEKQVSPIITDTANRLLQTLYDSPDVSTSIVHLLLATASENATIADLLSRYGHGQGLLMKGGLHIGSVVKLKTTSQYYTARQVIVTVPPVVTSAIRFSPPLPAEFLRFIESYAPTGRAYYFTLTYPSPFWRGQGRNGQLIYTNALGPIVWLTTFDVGLPTMCDGTGATGVLWGIAHFSQQMTTSQRHAAYVDIVTRSLGDYGQLPLDTSDENFVSDPFCQGSIAMLPPKFDVAGLRYIRGINHHGERVVFASAEYSNTSMGLMNGAVLSGQLAGASVAERLLDTQDEAEEDNEIANMVRLSDEIDKVGENHDESDSLEEETTPRIKVQSDFAYQTSTHYPPTTPADMNTFKHFSLGNTNGDVDKSEADDYEFDSNMDVESESVQSSFVYETSSQYPPTETIETSTFKHFSFGNADPVEEFVPPSLPLDPSATTAATTTTTERTTFTPVDPSRTTTPFEYETSTVNSIPPTVETSTFEHFSFGNSVSGESLF
ncbi:unnamed protein product [Angiostrongylus costaricensis]|uniref:monoamine oxidase n=1 Tax=Angiostrongylus costaricensis TaxID=334426 RepID=A0A0R3PZI3_ANGCS|nr:unnamed protein product [Angiostrongylus costaricensis]